MKILKFKQFARRRDGIYAKKPVDVAKLLVITSLVIAVLSAAIWLIRDARDLSETFRPTEGSLIVNINTGTSEELISVPGIGASRAAQIITGRPYATVDELANIAGIGDKSLESLRPFVKVEGDTQPFE